MYSQLYEVWKREMDEPDLAKLPPDFFVGIVEYMKKLKVECRMLDKRSIKASILKKETQNTKRMVKELVWARYTKIVNKAAKGEDISREALTAEEGQIYVKIPPMAETASNFTSEILQGREPSVTFNLKRKRITLRMLKEIPAIIGGDMKTYGPFKTEDVASLPAENARILVKQNMAEKLEIS